MNALRETLRPASFAALLVVTLLSISARGGEVHSNGIGGGDWSDPQSWREKMVPTEKDDAVISRGDVIEFDRDDEGKITCNQLFIDPKGTLALKTGNGKVVCCVGGAIETYGTVKIDGTRSATDRLELRFVGPAAENRVLKLLKGSALLLHGRRNLAHGRHNVSINSGLAEEKTPIAAEINANVSSIVDIQRAELRSVLISAYGIDNTGAKVNERINIVDNHLTALSSISLSVCDSPVIAGNLIEAAGVNVTKLNAIYIILSPLAEIRGNTIRGYYGWGVQARQQVDSAVTDNVIEGCFGGMYWYGTNGMIKGLQVRNCDTGVQASSMTGVFEDVVIDNCKTSYAHSIATAQLTNVQIINMPKNGVAVSYSAGPLTLLNCNVTVDQVKMMPKAPKKVKDGVPAVESMNYLIVKPQGKVPPGAVVEVQTANPASPLPPGAVDPNVRNSAAKILSNGMTPFPATLEPLIVKTWVIDDELMPIAPPQYKISVVVPSGGGESGSKNAGDNKNEKKVLATLSAAPDDTWYRPEPNATKPTVEIPIP